MTGRIDIVKALVVPVRPSAIREVLLGAARLPEVEARLPGAAWEVALRLSGDRELRRLNGEFLGEDHVTDVLSFPAGENGTHLGDIVISWPAATRQAVQFGHPEASELALLVVHGFLHLVGFDHADSRQENEMNRLTVMALAKSDHRLASGRLSWRDA